MKKQDFIGNWYSNDYDKSEFPITEITFDKDHAYLMDNYSFIEKYDYSINKKSILLEKKTKEFDTTLHFDKLKLDSLKINNRIFKLTNDEFYLDKINYSLIGFKTDSIAREFKSNITILHVSKSVDNKTLIRNNGKYIELKDLSFVTDSGHNYQSKIILFIGENIGLTEIQELHYRFYLINKVNVFYVVNKAGLNNYSIFGERIFSWGNDINKYLKENDMPSYPKMPLGFNSEQEFIKNDGLLIRINSIKDISKLKTINTKNKYAILISSKLSFENYYKIKKQVSEIRSERDNWIITKIEEE